MRETKDRSRAPLLSMRGILRSKNAQCVLSDHELLIRRNDVAGDPRSLARYPELIARVRLRCGTNAQPRQALHNGLPDGRCMLANASRKHEPVYAAHCCR